MTGRFGNWRAAVAPYQRSDTRRALIQLADTLLPLGLAFCLMHAALGWSPWLTLALSVPAAGLLVRTFIIMHDCGHGSFFASRRANDAVGYVTGVLTATPYKHWRHEHALHHASAGDLDRRGHGDVDTLTVREYLARGRVGRLRYRLYRHPAVLLLFGPLYMLVLQRLPWRAASIGAAGAGSIWTTDLGMAVALTAAVLAIGLQPVLWIYLPTAYLAASAGVALFFVQHQYESAYWERHDRWDFAEAAIAGSSHLVLPRVLQWFTGNIGIHHIHHLAPRVPNYFLERCDAANPDLHAPKVLTLASAAPCFRLALWDEDRGRMVGFADLEKATA